MKLAPKASAAAMTTLVLALAFLPVSTTFANAPQAATEETPAVSETPAADAVCAVADPEAARLFAPTFLAGTVNRSSCTGCSSSAECQPICGGEIGFDFVCHYDRSCGPWRVCICF